MRSLCGFCAAGELAVIAEDCRSQSKSAVDAAPQ